jgi:dihydroorotate dehydrogenase (fumarate)
LRSLFEEQIVREQMADMLYLDLSSESSAEAASYFPDADMFVLGPDEYLNHLRLVKEAVHVPVIGSLNGSTPGGWLSYGRLIEQAGADALELNVYHSPLDPYELEVKRTLHLSDSSELQLRLRGIAAIAPLVRGSLAVTGGVHTALDIVKSTMAGAHVTQMVSALLKNGPAYLSAVRKELEVWMEENEWLSLAEMRGNMSIDKVPNPQAYARANYMMMLQSWEGA